MKETQRRLATAFHDQWHRARRSGTSRDISLRIGRRGHLVNLLGEAIGSTAHSCSPSEMASLHRAGELPLQEGRIDAVTWVFLDVDLPPLSAQGFNAYAAAVLRKEVEHQVQARYCDLDLLRALEGVIIDGDFPILMEHRSVPMSDAFPSRVDANAAATRYLTARRFTVAAHPLRNSPFGDLVDCRLPKGEASTVLERTISLLAHARQNVDADAMCAITRRAARVDELWRAHDFGETASRPSLPVAVI